MDRSEIPDRMETILAGGATALLGHSDFPARDALSWCSRNGVDIPGQMAIVGLRYFNVVGPRQDPAGAYAAVIPRWISEFIEGAQPQVFGDGEITRDFCPIANVVQANLSAALCVLPTGEISPVCNIAMGSATSLNELFVILRDHISAQDRCSRELQPVYGAERDGDVRHSCANITSAETTINYQPCQTLEDGLSDTVRYYLSS